MIIPSIPFVCVCPQTCVLSLDPHDCLFLTALRSTTTKGSGVVFTHILKKQGV